MRLTRAIPSDSYSTLTFSSAVYSVPLALRARSARLKSLQANLWPESLLSDSGVLEPSSLRSSAQNATFFAGQRWVLKSDRQREV